MSGNIRTVALVTGATGAIGKAIARQLAANAGNSTEAAGPAEADKAAVRAGASAPAAATDEVGYEVVLAARDEEAARAAVAEIQQQTGNPHVRYELVDVSSRASIEALAARWRGPLHVLINDAAACPRRRLETPDGIEVQFATNVLGYVWMTLAFADALKASAPARVVNVASYWAGDLDLNDLEFKRRRYDNNAAYRQSKQANRMLTAALAERFAEHGVAVNSCHPGDVNSKLSNDLGFGGHESPDEGARTPVWLATSPIMQSETGQYFAHMRAEHDPFADDKAAIERLYELCLGY